MNKFFQHLSKFVLIVCITAALLLLGLAVFLLLAPQLLLKFAYYAAVAVCIVGAGYIIVSLLRALCSPTRRTSSTRTKPKNS